MINWLINYGSSAIATLLESNGTTLGRTNGGKFVILEWSREQGGVWRRLENLDPDSRTTQYIETEIMYGIPEQTKRSQ